MRSAALWVDSCARSEYQLTDKGRALMPVLATLAQGGEAYRA
ncbi:MULTISPECIES: winged helix-turn-helix transcriptional regulator [unclassified Pseudomonas]